MRVILTDPPIVRPLHSFKNLFELPRETSAQPVALGFDNFFRGAFSYHFHNFWYAPSPLTAPHGR